MPWTRVKRWEKHLTWMTEDLVKHFHPNVVGLIAARL
jgi:hypothetical protein